MSPRIRVAMSLPAALMSSPRSGEDQQGGGKFHLAWRPAQLVGAYLKAKLSIKHDLLRGHGGRDGQQALQENVVAVFEDPRPTRFGRREFPILSAFDPGWQ